MRSRPREMKPLLSCVSWLPSAVRSSSQRTRCLGISCIWSVVFGDLDLAYLVGKCTLDHFDAEGAAAVTAFIPQLWIPELRAFRQDPRFRTLATRLCLPLYWQRYGVPDDYDIRE
jgi:hypothetical protein